MAWPNPSTAVVTLPAASNTVFTPARAGCPACCKVCTDGLPSSVPVAFAVIAAVCTFAVFAGATLVVTGSPPGPA